MNEEILKAKWKEIKGKVKEQWGKLTDNEITEAEGNFEQLQARIQEAYGLEKDEAKKQLDDFLDDNK